MKMLRIFIGFLVTSAGAIYGIRVAREVARDVTNDMRDEWKGR